MLEQKPSDPTSLRREASLFDLPGPFRDPAISFWFVLRATVTLSRAVQLDLEPRSGA
jgi:hypothetical protein